jgi:hypothetical protein
MNTYVIIRDHSEGNESVGDMWKETKIFNGDATLDEVMAWGMHGEKERDNNYSKQQITITKPH